LKKISILCITVLIIGILFCQKNSIQKLSLQFSKILSSNGSTRATAYMMSNKIITANNKIFVAWLDRVADIQIKAYDIENDKWSETILIGKGVDNHSGPAITMDSEGYLHVVFGPHHGPFQYTRSSQPYEIDQWEPVELFGDSATYPSLVIDRDDRLHCTYRGGGPEPRRLIYQQKPKHGDWTDPLELVHPGVDSGYTQFGNSLMIAPDGTIHLGFHIYDRVEPAAGKSIGNLRSKDGGKTWQNANREIIDLPATPQSPCFIEQGQELDMRCGNLAIDPGGNPWLTAFHNETRPRIVKLWHHDGKEWQRIALLTWVQKHFPDWELLYSSITFDKDGLLYSVSVIQNAFADSYWGDPSLEIVLLTSADKGRNFELTPISTVDPNLPNWLPNIERPFSPKPIGVPSFLYTHGGPGMGLTDGDATEVVFVKLKKGEVN